MSSSSPSSSSRKRKAVSPAAQGTVGVVAPSLDDDCKAFPIPVTVWRRIASYMTCRDKLTGLGLVSKQFLLVVNHPDSWHSVACGQFKYFIGLHQVRAVASVWKNLKRLNLAECYGINDSCMELVCSKCPDLEYLNLTGCGQITDASLFTIGGGCHALKVLILCSCIKITDGGIRALVDGTPVLTDLDLWGCHELTDMSLYWISSHLTHLEALNLTWCRAIRTAGISSLSSCSKLKYLNLMWCDRITEEALHSLQVPKLTAINLDGCSRVSDYGITRLAQNCPALEYVSLRLNSRLSGAGLYTFMSTLPNLKVLDARHSEIKESDITRSRQHFPKVHICV